MKASSAMAMEIPMAIPRAASARTQAASVPMAIGPSATTGHRPARAKVKPNASAARAGSAMLRMPGRGTKMRAPLTRARTSRNENSVPVERVSSMGIAPQVAEQRGGVRHDLLQHPRHEEQQAGEKGGEARDGADGVVLDRGRDLDEADGE